MKRELTDSRIDRQNILNNGYALQKIQEGLDLSGMAFEGDLWASLSNGMCQFVMVKDKNWMGIEAKFQA